MLNGRILGVLVFVFSVIALTFTLPGSRLYFSDKFSRRPKQTASTNYLQPGVHEATSNLPPEYNPVPTADDVCSRFSSTYLEEFRAHAASYCEPGSRANLTCFHRHSGFNGKTDSFCFARGAALNAARGRFQLECALRQLSQQEQENGILSFDRLPGYWYETGPSNVFSLAIDVGKSKTEPPRVEKEETQEQNPSLEQSSTSQVAPPKKFLLLKREGEANPWHCLMEIFSTYLTFDILRTPVGSGDDSPLFDNSGDYSDTQVVILDERDDGPYFELWTMFARRKPMRLSELLADHATVSKLENIDLIIPLAGSSNPLWKDDDRTRQCTNAPTLDVFSRRVLNFYDVQGTQVREFNKPITVTFVKRRDSRRLQNQRYLFAELERRNLHIKVQLVDFAALPFSEQVRVAHETDVLVGIHGAGLTHCMFMRQSAGAVVEIQPRGMDHNGFRNVAAMRGLGYYRVHADTIETADWREGEESENARLHGRAEVIQPTKDEKQSMKHGIRRNGKIRRNAGLGDHEEGHSVRSTIEVRTDWHWMDIELEESRFFEVVEAAIKSMYSKGPWSYDID
jgi:EGF domain-specific O-GlcNAc transferase